MADTEYIEIHSSEVREDSTKMTTDQTVNAEGSDGEAPSKNTLDSDVDISDNAKAYEVSQATISLPDLVAGGEIQKTEVETKESVSSNIEEAQEQAHTPLDSLSEESAISNGNENEPFEVIDDAESQAVAQIQEDQKVQGDEENDAESSDPTEVFPNVSEDKLPSPFQRFRAMSKPSEKKDGSSITLPSIFSDISTSFMSLKSLGKKKESPSDGTPLKDINGDSTTTPSPGSTSTSNSSTVEQLRVERRNLLGMAKLSIKGLIESSLSAGHILDSDHAPLQQFFIIMESVLRHGLKSPKHIFAGNKQFWGPLEAIEKIADEAAEITNSVRELPGIKTHIGRARAWLRLALMQKRLSDYFRMMVEHRDIMKEFYEPESLILSEEGIVLSGHLVGLNCIDANLCMKGDDLDNQNAVIDYSLYIRDGNRLSISSESDVVNGAQEETKVEQEGETMEEKIQKLANQKNYLEERNRYLETTLTELQKRSGETTTSNQALETELDAAKISLTALQEERQRLLDEKENMTVTHRKILHDRQADLDMERETLVQSRAGLDDMLAQVKKQLKHETQMRMEVERELELQISLKQELEVAMKLLEKDIYSKQDSLVILREQLDNVKAINIDIYKKLQDKADAVEAKGKAITDLEDETKRLNEEVGKLKEKFSLDLLQVEKRRLDLALI